MNLCDQASFVTESGGRGDLNNLLAICLKEYSIEALAATELLARHMYGGLTFNYEMKFPAACCLLAWGTQGVTAIAELPKSEPAFKNYLIAIKLLAQLSAGEYPQFSEWMPRDLEARLDSMLSPISVLAPVAEVALNELMQSIPEEDATIYVGHALHRIKFPQGAVDMAPTQKIISSLALRYLVLGVPVIEDYERLLEASDDDEPMLQKFLERHPLLLDPVAVRVWPKPDLHGKKEPDFLLQRADGTYLVIEIETPAKRLMTDGNQISAKVTQAVSQVLDYREFLIARFESASRTFPDFRAPDALVIIGREDALDESQRLALRRENEGRSYLRIIGFDALASGARAMLRNLTQGRVQVSSVRLV